MNAWLEARLRARVAALSTERNQLQLALLAACAEAEAERERRRAVEANMRRLLRDDASARDWMRRVADLAVERGADACVRLAKALATSARLAEILRRDAA